MATSSSNDLQLKNLYDCMDVSILQVLNWIGDVKGKVEVMVDDMIDTAGKHSWIHATDLSLRPHFVNKWK